MQFSFQSDGSGALVDGYLMHDAPVQFPVAVVVPGGNDALFVLSMSSENKALNENCVNSVVGSNNNNNAVPNLTRGGPTPKFGNAHYLQLERLEISIVQDTFAPGW